MNTIAMEGEQRRKGLWFSRKNEGVSSVDGNDLIGLRSKLWSYLRPKTHLFQA